MNYPTVDEVLYGLHCELWDLYNLNPVDFVNRATKLVFTGAEREIVTMIMQSVQHFQQERAILNYIYIVDKLLKVPTFNENFQTVIVDLYSLIFISLWTQRCFSELEQIKILRKFWVGTLHPIILQQMKQSIFLRTGIDVDTGFKNQAISSIKEYYEKRLKMSPEQIDHYLPKPQHKISNNSQFDELRQREIGNNRRKQTDEETKYPQDGQIKGEKPRKRVHRQIQKPSYILILQKLKVAKPLSCRICGKNFSDQDLLDTHIDEHIAFNISAYEKGQKNPYRKKEKSRSQELTIEEWQKGNGKQQLECNKFCIPVLQLYKYECKFCCAEIQQRFNDDEWVYINAVKVQVNNETVFMHKTCHDALMQEIQ